MTTQLKIESHTEGERAVVLSLSGEVDVSNTARVSEAALKLLEGKIKLLLIDLVGVEYMDSSGLGTLVALLKRVRESGRDMAVAGARPRVRRVFEITGLDQVFTLHEDVAAALKEGG
jgi:anti-sigma B factor antagonist